MASQFTFEAIGTQWRIDIYEELSTEKENSVRGAIQARIQEFDLTYSRFKAESWIMKLAKGAGEYVMPHDAVPMFSLYKDVYGLTDGLVTPLIGQTLVDAGYDATYSFKEKKELTAPPKWEEALEYMPNATVPTIVLKKPVVFDVGAFGKGYLIDIVGGVIASHGIVNYCVDAGGDALLKGARSLRVGLEHPDNFSKIIGVATINDQSIAGSAGNRRKWGRFNHIINPKTLRSPDTILAVWVIADTAMCADAMATALYFCDPNILRAKYTFDFLIMYADHSVEGSLLNSSVLELY